MPEKKLLAYLGSSETRRTSPCKADPSVIATNDKSRPQSGYTALQKKSAEISSSRRSHIAQFLDRDTRPDFASTVMIPALQELHQDARRHRRAGEEHPQTAEVEHLHQLIR